MRRYEIDQYPVYDQRYGAFSKKSLLLNLDASDQPNRDLLAMRVSDKVGVKHLISEHQDRAERLQRDIEDIDEKHENLKIQARRGGKVEPAEMPKSLLEEKLQLEARLDVTTEELSKLKEMLSGYEAREQAEQDERLLKCGPIGSGRGDPLREIDGQAVVTNAEGELVICCEKSPYHQMKVSDYRTLIVAPFKKARVRKFHELDELIAQKKAELKKLEQSRGTPGPPPAIAWEDLPPRPAGI